LKANRAEGGASAATKQGAAIKGTKADKNCNRRMMDLAVPTQPTLSFRVSDLSRCIMTWTLLRGGLAGNAMKLTC
jgi:hypothetical protein